MALTPEEFVDLVRRLPDPSGVDPEDAAEHLEYLIGEAKAAGRRKNHPDWGFACSKCGVHAGPRPRFEGNMRNRRAVCDDCAPPPTERRGPIRIPALEEAGRGSTSGGQ